jgi:hypothetical protein
MRASPEGRPEGERAFALPRLLKALQQRPDVRNGPGIGVIGRECVERTFQASDDQQLSIIAG